MAALTAAAQSRAKNCAIRSLIRDSHGDAAADAVRIQYGGSVKAANVAEITGFCKGQSVDRSRWRASNVFAA